MNYRAVKAVIIRDKKLLLLQRNPVLRFEENWDLPGGIVEDGESDYEALFREVYEEIGSSITVLKYLGSWSFKRTSDGRLIVANNYLCHLNYDDKICLSEEHIAYKWIQPIDIVNFSLKDQSLIDNILDYIKTL